MDELPEIPKEAALAVLEHMRDVLAAERKLKDPPCCAHNRDFHDQRGAWIRLAARLELHAQTDASDLLDSPP